MSAPVPQSAASVDIKAIAEALGITRQAAGNRASDESWPFGEEPHPGNPKRYYPIATLPKEIQRALTDAADRQKAAEKQANLQALLDAVQQAKDVAALNPAAPITGEIKHDPAAAKRTEEALWIMGVIRPIVGLKRHSKARSAAIKTALAGTYTRGLMARS